MGRLIFAVFVCAMACSPSAEVVTSPAPATEVPGATQSVTRVDTSTPRPSACRVLPTPNYPEPSHAPVNGQPSLGVPTLPGVILVRIPQCRDIQAIVAKYGLPGPATRYIDVVESDEMIANGATRWFRVGVAPGTESATVVELYKHPEDIEYVQLIPEFRGGPAGG